MLPETGRHLPRRSSREIDLAVLISAALRQEVGNGHQAVKTLMRWTCASERTVKNWIAGTHVPQGRHLVGLVRESDEVMNVFLLAARRPPPIAAAKLIALRARLQDVVDFIDTRL